VPSSGVGGGWGTGAAEHSARQEIGGKTVFFVHEEDDNGDSYVEKWCFNF
jgi:hypothetical protein